MRVCAMFDGLTEFASYFDLVYVPVCWLSHREWSADSGGFRHVQHVLLNRGSHKKGLPQKGAPTKGVANFLHAEI